MQTSCNKDQIQIKANLNVAKEKLFDLIPKIKVLTSSNELNDDIQIAHYCMEKAIELVSNYLIKINEDSIQYDTQATLLKNEIQKTNTLSERCTKLESTLTSLEKKHTTSTQLNSDLTITNNQLSNQVTNLNDQLTQTANIQKDLDKKNEQYGKLQSEYNELKKLNPQELVTKVNRLDKTILKLETKNKNTVERKQGIIESLQQQNKILGERMAEKESEYLHGNIMGKDKKTEFTISVFEYELNFGMKAKDSFSLVSNLDWHVVVGSSKGIDIKVAVSEWLSPVPPQCQELCDVWPKDLNLKLHEVFMNRMKKTHPHLISRINKAKKLFISTHADFNDTEQKALKKCKFINLFDAVSTSFYTFRQTMLDNSKLSEEEVRSVHERIITISQTIQP
ncbi:hypothetical protein [Aliivibrio fischeri]|uniref:hypothetical protein n=1 Tax=Aliivibrio fischeri TaxID=668 RepID=UPI0007C5BEDE|nr:hypothetical protein [Aliivibrio fischeri]